MSWNYRIVEYHNGSGFGLHEVYYNEAGEPATMSERPTGFVGESPDEISDALAVAGDDMLRRPVLKEPAEWPGLPGADGE